MPERVDETDNAIEFLMQDLEMELTCEHIGAFQVIMDEVKKLRQVAINMSCLEMMGVDNWSGYGEHYGLMKEYYPEEYKRRFGE